MTEPIRVAVVDDHPLFAQGAVEILDRMPGISAVGFAFSLEEAQRLIAETRPDVVLCDVMLGGRPDGFELPKLLGDDPQARPPVIFVSHLPSPALVARAQAEGAAGFLEKTAEPETIRAAILAVAAGSAVFPRRTSAATDGAVRLPSPRELAILHQVADGRSNQEIAADLGIGVSTVESHLERMRVRYELPTRTQLAVFAVRQGWLT